MDFLKRHWKAAAAGAAIVVAIDLVTGVAVSSLVRGAYAKLTGKAA